jgi:hypothetical protein
MRRRKKANSHFLEANPRMASLWRVAFDFAVVNLSRAEITSRAERLRIENLEERSGSV